MRAKSPRRTQVEFGSPEEDTLMDSWPVAARRPETKRKERHLNGSGGADVVDLLLSVVPTAGLEPAIRWRRQVDSLLRIPVSPHGLWSDNFAIQTA